MARRLPIFQTRQALMYIQCLMSGELQLKRIYQSNELCQKSSSRSGRLSRKAILH